MQIGSYQIDAIEAGEFRLDGGAMFGVVPKVLWEKQIPADDKNRIPMALRCCLIRGSGKTILVDTGIGHKWNEKQKSMYAIDHSRFDLDRSLEKVGVTRGDITDVVVSHLHFDHVGGATFLTPEGKPELTFPRATYYVQKANLSHAHAPTEKDRASFIEQTISPLLNHPQLKIIDGNAEIAPKVKIWVTQGHTPGHQMVLVSSGETSLLCPGDTIPTSAHIPIPWVMSYDLYPMTTMEEKRQILDRAVRGNWALFFVHDTARPACRVGQDGEKYFRGEDVGV